MKLNFRPTKGTPVVKKPHYTVVEREADEPSAVSSLHPHHDLMVRMRAVATTFEIGRRVMMAEKEVGPNVWAIFRRLSTDDASEEELVAMMDREIPGLGQVAQVFGTENETTREENIWKLLKFFLSVQIKLSQSPRTAWRDKKLRDKVLEEAQKVPR